MTTAFDEAWHTTGKAERGYVNNPLDPGKETNFGITIAVARANGYDGRIVDLSPTRAREIAKDAYWNTMTLDSIALLSRRVAQELFDTGFNMGVGTAAHMLQRALNALNRQEQDYQDLVQDGKLGPKTRDALSRFLRFRGTLGETVLLRALNGLQLERYIYIVEHREESEDFLFGWISHRVVV